MAEAELKRLGGAVLALIGTAVTSIMGIAVITGFKDSGKVDNTTADSFISGIAIVGGFISVIMLALIGKTVIGMFKTEG